MTLPEKLASLDHLTRAVGTDPVLAHLCRARMRRGHEVCGGAGLADLRNEIAEEIADLLNYAALGLRLWQLTEGEAEALGQCARAAWVVLQDGVSEHVPHDALREAPQ